MEKFVEILSYGLCCHKADQIDFVERSFRTRGGLNSPLETTSCPRLYHVNSCSELRVLLVACD